MTQTIKINEVYPNPESGSEWIEFIIEGGTTENFSPINYTIFDSYHQIHKFTDEHFDGQLLVVEVSGLNNDQDSVVLKDVSGNILDSFSYSSTQKGLSWTREPETNNFLLSETTPGQINQTPTPTLKPTSPITIAPTSSPTIVTSTPPNSTQNDSATASNSTKTIIINPRKYAYNLAEVKIATEDKAAMDINTRLVVLGKNQNQIEFANAIIGSSLIILSSLYLIYVKRKSKQN